MMKQAVTINNKTGIHARPASDLLKICASYPCNVEIISRGKTYNAKHITGTAQTHGHDWYIVSFDCLPDLNDLRFI